MKGERGSAYRTVSFSGYKNLSLSHAEEVLLLNTGTRWQRSTSLPGHFTSGKEHRYPLNRRPGGLKTYLAVVKRRIISC
jgi:hypothetical protein